jgi:hypothetical protein
MVVGAEALGLVLYFLKGLVSVVSFFNWAEFETVDDPFERNNVEHLVVSY